MNTSSSSLEGCCCSFDIMFEMRSLAARGVVMATTTLVLLFLLPMTGATADKIPLGAIFEQGTDEVQSAFKFAMLNHNQNITIRRFELHSYVDVINTADAYKLSHLICKQFSRGVFSMLGAVNPDSFDTLHSYSNTFKMPFVTPWFPEKVLTPSSGFLDYAISMRPDYHQAIIDVVRYYGWRKIIYLYDSHDDPFADAIKGADDDVQDGLVHIRIQQRNGRKTLTTVQGLSSEYDLKKIVRACKKEFACNGTVIEHPEYGEVLQLQGDQRENICQWLTKAGLAKPEQLKVHGF